jgi:hypothetical protein
VRTTIIKGDNIRQETWTFELYTSFGDNFALWLDRYSVGTKQPSQRKFRNQGWWNRIDKRDNTMIDPPLPAEVEAEAKQYFIERIKATPITI